MADELTAPRTEDTTETFRGGLDAQTRLACGSDGGDVRVRERFEGSARGWSDGRDRSAGKRSARRRGEWLAGAQRRVQHDGGARYGASARAASAGFHRDIVLDEC